MKDVSEIIRQTPIFLNDWADSKENGLLSDFKINERQHILFASYSYANYSGEAWVLFEKDGKLYEVNGSHCSCYGLEGQWEPEETTLAALSHRLEKGTFGQNAWVENLFKTELCDFLGINNLAV